MSKALKSALPLFLGIAAFAGAVVAFAKPTAKPSRVTGKSGQSWDVVLEGRQGDVGTYAVYVPAGSIGNTTPSFVVRYQQTGSNTSARPVVNAGKNAVGPLLNNAIGDFGLSAAGSLTLI